MLGQIQKEVISLILAKNFLYLFFSWNKKFPFKLVTVTYLLPYDGVWKSAKGSVVAKSLRMAVLTWLTKKTDMTYKENGHDLQRKNDFFPKRQMGVFGRL